MSYGVIASKSATVMVETTSGLAGSDSDAVLDRFESIWGSAKVSGRLTLTRLHLNFIPARAGRGMAMMDLDLRDILQVELAGGRTSRVVGLRTRTHLVQVRALGAGPLAREVAALAESAKERPSRQTFRGGDHRDDRPR